MPSSLTREQALAHFLGFAPEHAIVVGIAGRAPWHVPPTEDPRQLSFDGIDGDDLVDQDLQAVVRRRHGSKGHRLGDTEIWWPPISVPPEFAVRKSALGWRNLRGLRQFLREVFPRDSGIVVDAPSEEQMLLDERDGLVERLRGYFGRSRGSTNVRNAARAFLREDLSTESAALYGTLRALRAQQRLEAPFEEDAIRRDILAEEDADRTKVELPEPLRVLAAGARDGRRAGRRPSTSLVVRAARHYRLKPREVAMLVALERDEIAPFESDYSRYFEPKKASAASTAWNKIYHRAP